MRNVFIQNKYYRKKSISNTTNVVIFYFNTSFLSPGTDVNIIKFYFISSVRIMLRLERYLDTNNP